MATILTGTGTQVSSASVVPRARARDRIDLSFFSSTEVSVFLETERPLNLIFEIGQETTVLTTLPFLVVSGGFVPLFAFVC